MVVRDGRARPRQPSPGRAPRRIAAPPSRRRRPPNRACCRPRRLDVTRDPADRLAERDAALRAFTGLSEPDREALRLVAWERLSLADAANAARRVSRPAFAMRVQPRPSPPRRAPARAGRRPRPRSALGATRMPDHRRPRARRAVSPCRVARCAPRLRPARRDVLIAPHVAVLDPCSGARPCLIPFSSCASPTPPRTLVPRRRATCSSASSPRRSRRRARRAGVGRGIVARRGGRSPRPRWWPSPRCPAATTRPGRSGRASPSARSPRPRRSRSSSPTRRRPPSRRGNPRTESYDKLRQWQYGDRMHNFMETRQRRGEWVYEHDQNGATFRTLMNNDKGGKEIQVTKKTDPGWDQEELEYGLQGRRDDPGGHGSAKRSAAREDLGETTFNGKRAHAYRCQADFGTHAARRHHLLRRSRDGGAAGQQDDDHRLRAERRRRQGRVGRRRTRSSSRRPSIATTTSSRRPRT